MSEVRFHHCERRRVDQALPDLVARLYAEGRRVVVRAPSAEMVQALNDRLWTWDEASFLPHGAAGDGDPATQPVFLTDTLGNPNAATVLVLLAGAETSPGDDAFDTAIRLFDGRDEEALGEARRAWKRLRDAGLSPSYWREGEDGGWDKAR
ncbi:DNA polymerase III chi subunit [Roseiarcus fermentans]|uniref:DNA polymerase III chi subunit n=1 Tax=Roseiarcus fermentans TaxID=1473586 RepID=A0A366FRC9_9HYPH|nr:DNA polymerase III subunit chi [Roseiarcus fermentans]RBP17127.1 DNA polymerase III chi subunit [Roseiarcus fermentans]